MTTAVLQKLFERLRADTAFRQQLFVAPRATLAGYDLTEEERLALILPNFSWLVPGELAGSARPMSDDAFDALAAQGVRAVITLTEEPLPAIALRGRDLDVVHLPVADYTPPTQEQIAAAIAAIARFGEAGRPVLVHCAAGIGRTGTILACALVSRGQDAAAAIAAVRAARPGSIETPEQEAAVGEWQSVVRSR